MRLRCMIIWNLWNESFLYFSLVDWSPLGILLHISLFPELLLQMPCACLGRSGFCVMRMITGWFCTTGTFNLIFFWCQPLGNNLICRWHFILSPCAFRDTTLIFLLLLSLTFSIFLFSLTFSIFHCLSLTFSIAVFLVLLFFLTALHFHDLNSCSYPNFWYIACLSAYLFHQTFLC